MTEQEWQNCNSPEAMLNQLQGKISDRQARLAAVAAFRRPGTIAARIGFALATEFGEKYTEVLDLAECLADGELGLKRAMADEPAKCKTADYFGLFSTCGDDPSMTLPVAFGSAINHAAQCAQVLFAEDCLTMAWQTAFKAAWNHWRGEVKNRQPLLSDHTEIMGLLIQENEQHCYPDWGRETNPWNYARGKLMADDTHNPAWDTVWDQAWLRAWQTAWLAGWGSPWETLRTCMKGDELTDLDEEWRYCLAGSRRAAWNLGPWHKDEKPVRRSYVGQTDWSEVHRICNGAVQEAEGRRHAAILREVFGNPFRPLTIDPTWKCGTVPALARLAYDERVMPSGILDPTRLAALADALVQADCAEPTVLSHLRDPGPHVRGCWAVELLKNGPC